MSKLVSILTTTIFALFTISAPFICNLFMEIGPCWVTKYNYVNRHGIICNDTITMSTIFLSMILIFCTLNFVIISITKFLD